MIMKVTYYAIFISIMAHWIVTHNKYTGSNIDGAGNDCNPGRIDRLTNRTRFPIGVIMT